ncbi:hypothetical protein ACFWWA_18535 [Streptomyces goshikiensis]|uniref:hypothetical protein n=1 Tax=Streptomyces goshikiensis TaxID=1942 RepID=UPI0036673E82
MIGTFLSLALLFDGLSLTAKGTGVRRIPGLVREDEAPSAPAAVGEAPRTARGAAEKRAPEEQERSNN